MKLFSKQAVRHRYEPYNPHLAWITWYSKFIGDYAPSGAGFVFQVPWRRWARRYQVHSDEYATGWRRLAIRVTWNCFHVMIIWDWNLIQRKED